MAGFSNAIGVFVHECLTHKNAQQKIDQCVEDHCSVKISITVRFHNLVSFCLPLLLAFCVFTFFYFCLLHRDYLQRLRVETISFFLHLVYLQNSRSLILLFAFSPFTLKLPIEFQIFCFLLHWETHRVGEAQFLLFTLKILVDL
jgi:hypothetical protein